MFLHGGGDRSITASADAANGVRRSPSFRPAEPCARVPPDPTAGPDPARWRRRALAVVKFVVVVTVVAFVWRTLQSAAADLARRELEFDPLAALGSAVAYGLALGALGLFWREAVRGLGQPAPLGPAVAAFFLSQLGKYVPGKATVLLVRTERLLGAARRRDPRAAHHASVAALAASVFYETLTFMAVGALLSAALLGGAPRVASGRPWLAAGLVLLALALAAPTAPPVFGWLVARLRWRGSGESPAPPPPPWRVNALGFAASLAAWGLLGLSAALAAAAVGVAIDASPRSAALWTLAATLPTVAGFLSFLPGGLVVREAAGLLVLTPALGEADALAATVAARVVAVATEVAVCASLLASGLLRRRPPPPDPGAEPRAES